MRERQGHCCRYSSLIRITPACAGKTYRSNRHRYRLWDHPRMCGKDRLTQQSESLTTGSPPHVRERLRDAHRPRLVPGITPACAGKTSFCYLFVRLHEDHPRMCGKDLIQYHSYNPPLGSPPHVRERRVKKQEEGITLRITPACAGKTML